MGANIRCRCSPRKNNKQQKLSLRICAQTGSENLLRFFISAPFTTKLKVIGRLVDSSSKIGALVSVTFKNLIFLILQLIFDKHLINKELILSIAF